MRFIILLSLRLALFSFFASAAMAQAGGFPDLVGGLKATPGCLGVETARTGSGKNVIFAWFENKQAVLNWYHSEMHQGVMKNFSSSYTPRTPLEGVPDGLGPIMAIASITMASEAQLKETQMPISQIAIELYTPVTGGIYLGSRFAPDGVEVSNLKDLNPDR